MTSYIRKGLCLLLCLVLTIGVLPPSASAASRIDTLMESMTLRQKITQMLMVDFRYWDENTNDEKGPVGVTVMNDQIRAVVENYDFGAVIYFAQNLTGTEQAFDLTTEFQKAATQDGGIPLLICADQEGGSVYRLGSGTALPGNMALGATDNVDYAKISGRIIGSELSALGINTNLAPVVDVNNNAANPVIGLRSYSDSPVIVGNMAAATISGMADYNVIGCAKHFPGHGDTATDSHYGLPVVNKPINSLEACELKPYEIAIEQGIEMIMTAHILYPQLERDKVYSQKTGKSESLPATMSDDILTDLLKDQMGFNGIVVTDAMNMAGISDNWTAAQAVTNAISAGADMICMPCTLSDLNDLTLLDAIIDEVQLAVESNQIPISRINDAVKRILTVKENRGVLDWNETMSSADNAAAIVGSDFNRQLEREMSAASVTVVQNKNKTLPLNITDSSKVLMLVPYDNERSQMLMGWNRAKVAGLIPEGAEVKVFRFNSADYSTETKALSDTLKSQVDWANTVIINSEVSSASRIAGNHWLFSVPFHVVHYAESKSKITVVQSVDKPYDVQAYPNADAVLAVYGCKGSSVDVTEALVGGATDSKNAYGPNIIAGIEVILGTFGAQGTLPVDIPLLKNGTYCSELAFARGFGLAYAAKHTHSLSQVKATAVACTNTGFRKDFYLCSGCGMWFHDSKGLQQVWDKYAIYEPASGHTFDLSGTCTTCFPALPATPSGSITVQSSAGKNGIAADTVTDQSGHIQQVFVKIPPSAIKDSSAITLPLQTTACSDLSNAAEIHINIPSQSALVEIPVTDVTADTVCVQILPDGTAKTLTNSILTETGIVVFLQENSILKIAKDGTQFSDVHAVNHWASEAIDFVVARKLFYGTGETTFSPNGTMSRQALWMVLARISGETPANMEAARTWAVEHGISDGSTPSGALSRQQLAAMLYRYAQAQGISLTESEARTLQYSDAASVADYAYEALCWCTEHGILNGYQDNALRPGALASRAHAATMIRNFLYAIY